MKPGRLERLAKYVTVACAVLMGALILSGTYALTDLPGAAVVRAAWVKGFNE